MSTRASMNTGYPPPEPRSPRNYGNHAQQPTCKHGVVTCAQHGAVMTSCSHGSNPAPTSTRRDVNGNCAAVKPRDKPPPPPKPASVSRSKSLGSPTDLKQGYFSVTVSPCCSHAAPPCCPHAAPHADVMGPLRQLHHIQQAGPRAVVQQGGVIQAGVIQQGVICGQQGVIQAGVIQPAGPRGVLRHRRSKTPPPSHRTREGPRSPPPPVPHEPHCPVAMRMAVGRGRVQGERAERARPAQADRIRVPDRGCKVQYVGTIWTPPEARGHREQQAPPPATQPQCQGGVVLRHPPHSRLPPSRPPPPCPHTPASHQPDRIRVPDYSSPVLLADRSHVPSTTSANSKFGAGADGQSETLTLKTSDTLRTPIVVKTVHFAEQLETRYSLQSLCSDSSDPDYDDVPGDDDVTIDDNANETEGFCDEDEQTEVKHVVCDDVDGTSSSDTRDNLNDNDVTAETTDDCGDAETSQENNNSLSCTSQTTDNSSPDYPRPKPLNVISCPPVPAEAPLAEEEELSDGSESTLEADRPDDIEDTPLAQWEEEPESPQMGNGSISAKKLLQDALINKEQLLGTLKLPKQQQRGDEIPRKEAPRITTPVAKPTVKNVKLVKHESLRQWEGPRRSKSHEELERLDLFVDMADIDVDYRQRAVRSSFLEEGAPERFSACLDIGDYQTILKRSRGGKSGEGEHIYSLPQPQCYGVDTLRAVKVITEKYDTFRRRQLTEASFRDGDPQKPPPGVTSSTPPDVILGPLGGVAAGVDGVWIETPGESDDSAPGDLTPDLLHDLTPQESARIGLFYRGFGTQVVVCSCYADLYMGSNTSRDDVPGDWEHVHSGIPVFVLNTGVGKRQRELFVLLAEKETGFPIWQDKITYLSEYQEESADPCVHSLRLSGSISRVAKLRMPCASAAQHFIEQFREMTSDPEDDLWKVSLKDRRGKGKKSSGGKKAKKVKRPSKKEISHPCNFSHVTRLDPRDPTLESIALPAQPPLPVTGEGEFRRKAPTH